MDSLVARDCSQLIQLYLQSLSRSELSEVIYTETRRLAPTTLTREKTGKCPFSVLVAPLDLLAPPVAVTGTAALLSLSLPPCWQKTNDSFSSVTRRCPKSVSMDTKEEMSECRQW